MPAEGVPLSEKILTAEEIYRLASIFHKLGVTKVRLTGGEPLVRKDLIPIVQHLSTLFKQIGITTNGSLLSRKLPKLAESGLTHLNISLDSLVPAKNEFITRRPGTTAPVLQAISQSIELGLSTKLNVVAMRNFNDDEFADFAEMTRDKDIDVRFIEFMPFDQNDWKSKKFIP